MKHIQSLALGAVLISFAPLFVKAISISSTLIGFYRCFFAASILFIFYAVKKSHPLPLLREIKRDRKSTFNFIAAGIFFGLDLFVWHKSVLYVGSGISTVLANTQVFYLTLIGHFLFKEKVPSYFWLAIFIAILGVFLLVDKNLGQINAFYGQGIFFGLLAGIFYSGFLINMRQLEKRHLTLPSGERLQMVCLISSFILFLLASFEGQLALPDLKATFMLLILAFFIQILAWKLIVESLPKVPLATGGLILLIQPALSTVLGQIIFHETLSGVQFLGLILTLFGIYLGTLKRA